MNRKLLNGLLVLAVAAGGVGTFTSCKDESFSNDVLLQQDALAVQIQAIRNVDDAKFKAALENWLNGWTDDITGQGGFQSYEEMVKAAQAMWDLYGQIMAGQLPASLVPFASTLMNWMWDNGLKADVQSTIQSYGYQTKDQVDAAIKDALMGYVTESQMTQAIQDALKGYVTLTEVENMLAGYATTADLEAFKEEWLKKLEAYATTEDVNAAIEKLKNELEALIHALEFNTYTHPSSIEISRVFNPVFGSINLPVGINSTVLATYIYEGTDANFSFPAESYMHLAEATPYSPDENLAEVIANLSAGVSEDLKNGSFTAPDALFGNMGGAVLAINPSINDFLDSYKVELVRSNGDNPFSTVCASESEEPSLVLKNFNDDLYFGLTRDEASSNNLYALQVNATKSNYKGLIVDIDKSDLKDAFKQLVDEKNVSSVAHLGEVVFRSVNNKLPAYAVKVSWNEGTEEMPVWNSIYSSYDIAATVVHPLSYGAMISAVLPSDKKLPYISPLEDYLERIQNKLDFEYTGIEGIDDVELHLAVKIEGNNVIFSYTDEYGETITMVLPYYLDGIEATDGQLQLFVNNILEAINYELGSQLNYQLIKDINKSIANINDQLKQYDGQVGDLQKYLEDIKNSKKLTYANKLVDIYNQLAKTANKFLNNPDHYLQVMMAYSAGNGPHHMSPRIDRPTTVDSSLGDGFEVYVSSHTGDVVVPSYKKYVAVTGVVNADGSVSTADLMTLNSNAGLNQVLNGTQERVAININALKGKTVRLTYISVDYRGMCSMENYYLRVK